MALVLTEEDYKRFTLFTKIFGVIIFAMGTIQMVDHQRWLLGALLVLFGALVALAPIPMKVVASDEPKDGEYLTVQE